MIPLHFYDQEEIPDRYFPSLWSVYSVVRLVNYFIMWFSTHCGQLMCLIFPQQRVSAATDFLFTVSLKYYSTKGSFPVYLHDSFSRTPILSQFTDVLHVAGIFCKCCPRGNCYSITSCLLWVQIMLTNQSNKTNIYAFMLCMSAQGAHSQRSGGAPEGSPGGRHLHAWGHPEGEQLLHVQQQISIWFYL